MRKHVLTVAVGDPPRLAAFLSLRLGVAAARAAAWIERGAVAVDGRRAVADEPLARGAKVILRELPEPGDAVAADEDGLRLVYLDEEVLVADKPAGLLSQPSPGERRSLEAQVQRRYPEARMLHRLDRDASGLVLFARRALPALQRALTEGHIERDYLAVCAGTLATPQAIRLRIAVDGRDRRRRLALPERDPSGEPACTHIEPLERLAPPRFERPATLLAVALETGRTHQIRVHLAALGHPLLGDRLYGGPPAPRLLLHARRLAFPHPATGRVVRVESSAHLLDSDPAHPASKI